MLAMRHDSGFDPEPTRAGGGDCFVGRLNAAATRLSEMI